MENLEDLKDFYEDLEDKIYRIKSWIYDLDTNEDDLQDTDYFGLFNQLEITLLDMQEIVKDKLDIINEEIEENEEDYE